MDVIQRPRQIGFTLIELLVTVAIVAVLASLTLPLAETVARRNKEQELKYALRQIRNAIDGYKKATDDGRVPKGPGESGYPENLEVLVKGAKNQKDPNGRMLYFLRSIPRDPFADQTLSADGTWGKRSYESSHDDPREGADIYDVYSLNQGTGINGIPYREW